MDSRASSRTMTRDRQRSQDSLTTLTNSPLMNLTTLDGYTINRDAIPIPTYLPPDPTKKSHARKQPAGHVARPRNAFILFRCDFVRQGKVPPTVERDHRNISRIAGNFWRHMSEADKSPWVRMAEREKAMHKKANPGYRYTPVGVPVAKRRKVNTGDTEMADSFRVQGRPRRSSSCPPASLDSTPLYHHTASPFKLFFFILGLKLLYYRLSVPPPIEETLSKQLLYPPPQSTEAHPKKAEVRTIPRPRRPSSCPPYSLPECPPHLIVPSQGRPIVDQLSDHPLQTGAYPSLTDYPPLEGWVNTPNAAWQWGSWDGDSKTVVPELDFFVCFFAH
jgi:hypothetical protein